MLIDRYMDKPAYLLGWIHFPIYLKLLHFINHFLKGILALHMYMYFSFDPRYSETCMMCDIIFNLRNFMQPYPKTWPWFDNQDLGYFLHNGTFIMEPIFQKFCQHFTCQGLQTTGCSGRLFMTCCLPFLICSCFAVDSSCFLILSSFNLA